MGIYVDTKKHYSHKFMRQVKRLGLVPIIIVLLFLFTYAFATRNDNVVAGVQSHVNLEYGGETYKFDTYKTELLDAVREQGVHPYDQDVFSIPRETKLNGQELSVVVTKSLPVVINDAGKKINGRAVYSEPEKILEQNKIEFWPEDIISTELIMDPVTAGGAGQMVVIKRAPVYTVQVDGKAKEVRTWETGVKTIIEKSETKLNPNDFVVPGLSETASIGVAIVIVRINYADVTDIKPIPYETIYQGSTALAFGKTQTLISGITGSKTTTYRITYRDGEEVSRTVLSSKVTQPKRDAKITRGAVTGKCKWGPYYENRYGPYTTAFHFARSEHDPRLIGRYILVTNLANGKSVKVKIVDAGPIYDGILDLSTTAMREIGGPLVTFYGNIPSVSVQLLD